MTLKAYLIAWLMRFCHYNNLDWLCEALEIFPRAKQLSSEALDMLRKKIDLMNMNLTESFVSGGFPNHVPDVLAAIPLPTTKTFLFLGVLLAWGYAFNWITNPENLQKLIKDRGWTFLEKFSPDRSLERSIGVPMDLEESSGYTSLNNSESSFLSAHGFDASFERVLTIVEVQDFKSLFTMFDVVTCEAIAENTYFLRCHKERLCLSLIEVSELQTLEQTYLADLEFFVRIAANGTDYANEAHALDVREIIAVFDSRDNLNSIDLDISLNRDRFLAVIHHYERSVDFRRFCIKHPTAAEITLILEDITTSLRSLMAAAARCAAEIPAQFLIALVRCSHDERDPNCRDRSLTCLNAFGVSVRLNPMCLKVGVPLDQMFLSVAFYRHRLEGEKEDCHTSVDYMVKNRAIKTCTDLLLVLGDLLRFNEEGVRNFIPDQRVIDSAEKTDYNLFSPAECF